MFFYFIFIFYYFAKWGFREKNNQALKLSFQGGAKKKWTLRLVLPLTYLRRYFLRTWEKKENQINYAECDAMCDVSTDVICDVTGSTSFFFF